MRCRGTLLPDPRYDAMRCIVMAIMDDDEVAADLSFTTRILLWGHDTLSIGDGLANIQVSICASLACYPCLLSRGQAGDRLSELNMVSSCVALALFSQA